MKLTLLSPGFKQLEALSERWAEELEAAGLLHWTDDEILDALVKSRTLAPTEDFLGGGDDFLGGGIDVPALVDATKKSDRSPANGSSIAFVAAFGEKQCLFSGDAYSEVLQGSVARMVETPGERLKLDAFKIPHHGSRANVHDELLALLDCRRFLVSTDGSRFKHPDGQAIARLVGGTWRSAPHKDRAVELNFNYRSKFNEPWSAQTLRDTWNYTVVFPDETSGRGLVVTLEP